MRYAHKRMRPAHSLWRHNASLPPGCAACCYPGGSRRCRARLARPIGTPHRPRPPAAWLRCSPWGGPAQGSGCHDRSGWRALFVHRPAAAGYLSASNDGGFCAPLGTVPQNSASSAVKGITPSACGFGVLRTSDPAAYNAVMGGTDNDGGAVTQPARRTGRASCWRYWATSTATITPAWTASPT
jgi:hypothetical protein